MLSVTFMPSGKSVSVPAGSRLTDACRQAGFALPAPCGEKGLCGKCRIKVLEGDIPADSRQRACLPEKLLAAGWRAACVALARDNLVLQQPDANNGEIILTDFMARGPRGESGWWEKDLAMSPPSADDQVDDLTRFLAALGNPTGQARAPAPALPLLSRLPAALRESGYAVTAVGLDDHILAVLPRETGGLRKLGLAVDIGTTTIAAALCDLDTGAVLSIAAKANPQSIHGDDVISRIDYASRGAAELTGMRDLVVDAVEELSAKTCGQIGAPGTPLFIAIGANTVMNHLLLGVPPGALAQSPFIPAFRGPLAFPASGIGWKSAQPPWMYIIPNIAAYVGGDITAGILAHDIHRQDKTILFLDVGTNGEIVLSAHGRLYACATAAGPAFEGARIRQGMRAMAGAISRVGIADGTLEIGVVDAVRPAQGICGTGLLDAVAVLLRTGLMDSTGRLLDADEVREVGNHIAPPLIGLVHEDDDGTAVWLERPAGRGGSGVSLTQRDVREFQLAKGAIAAGVAVLLGVAGIAPEQVDEVILAGGFGNYLDPASAITVGLLPAGIGADKVRSVGNAALAGTRLCLLSEQERRETESIIARAIYVELSGRDDFQHAFAEHMLFPDYRIPEFP